MQHFHSPFNSANSHFFGFKSRFLVYGQPKEKAGNEPGIGEYFPHTQSETPVESNMVQLQKERRIRQTEREKMNAEIGRLENQAKTLTGEINAAKKHRTRRSAPPLELVFSLRTAVDANKVDANKSLQRVRQYQNEKLNRKQKNLLNDLEKILTQLQQAHLNALGKKSESAFMTPDERDVEEMTNFSRRKENLNKGLETRKLYYEKEAYQKIQADFKLATDHWLLEGENEKFSHFWETPSGFSAPKQNESEKWFMALAATETQGFENDLLLNLDGMGEDPLVNQQKFPDLYQEWLKIKGIKDTWVHEGDQLIQAKVKLMEQEGVPKVQTILQILGQIPRKGNSQLPEPFKLDPNAPNYPEQLRDYTDAAIGKVEIMIYSTDPLNEDQALEEEETIETLKTLRDQLVQHNELTTLQTRQNSFLEHQQGKSERFIFSELSAPHNRQLRVELAMRRFAAAKKMVEAPFNQTQWNHLHPMVNGLLTSAFYKAGVSVENFDQDGYPQSSELSQDYAWILAEVTQSPIFNASSRESNLTPEGKEVMMYAQAAIQVTKMLHHSPEDSQKNPRALQQEKVLSQEFFQLTKAAIKNPRGSEAGSLKYKIQQKYFDSILNAEQWKQIQSFQQSVEFNYKAFDLNDSQSEQLSEMGLDLQGFHFAYRQELAKDISLNVEKWNALLYSQNPQEFRKIYDFFEDTLPENMEGGKDRFLAGLRVLNTRHKQNGLKEVSPEEADIIQTVEELATHIRKAEEIAAFSDSQNAEIESTLNGELMVDKFGHLVEGVIDGLRNPHDYTTFVSSAIVLGAGGFLAYQLLTTKGDDVPLWIKAGRWGVGLTALNVVVEKTTGRGIASLTGINSISQKIERTQEAVLLEKGNANMEKKNITREQHANAIYELNKLPFHQLMAWYQNSDENGMPLEGQKDLLPGGIDFGRIYKGEILKDTNHELEARRILKETVGQFFAYVSQKESNRHGTPAHGEDILKERWVNSFKSPNVASRRNTLLSPYIINHYKNRLNELTFERVTELEVDLFDIEETVGKHGITPALDILEQAGRGLAEWSREKEGQIEGYIEGFMPTMIHQKDQLADFLIEMGEAGGRGLEFGANQVKFWFEGNEYRIRQFGRTGVEIVLESGEMVLSGSARLAEGGANWTLETVRGLNKIISQDNLEPLKGSALTLADIAPSPEVLGSQNPEKNPSLAYFGRYQKPFYKALAAKNSNTPAFFETPDMDSPQSQQEAYPDEKVGYFISEVKKSELNLTPNATPNEINSKLQVESRHRARRFFIDKGLTGEEVDKYLYPVHIMRGIEPEQMATFWRMPMPGGYELWQKNNDKWAGSLDPKRHLHSLPFELDPNADALDQLMQLYGVKAGEAGVIAEYGTNLGSRPFTFALRNIEWVGGVAGGVVDFMKEDTELSKIISLLTQRGSGFKTNAAEFTTDLSYDPWYEDSPMKQGIYQICLAHAREYDHRLYLGIFKSPGMEDYKGTRYLQRPPQFQNEAVFYQHLKTFYEDVYKPKNGENSLFENMVDQKLKQYPGVKPAPTPAAPQPAPAP